MPNVINGLFPQLYRYSTALTSQGVRINCRPYIAVLETECYYWVVPEGTPYWAIENLQNLVREGKKFSPYVFGYRLRKVAKDAARSYCHADKWKAWISFQARTDARARRLQLQVEQVNRALDHIKGNETNPPNGDLNLGHTPYTEGLSWDEY